MERLYKPVRYVALGRALPDIWIGAAGAIQRGRRRRGRHRWLRRAEAARHSVCKTCVFLHFLPPVCFRLRARRRLLAEVLCTLLYATLGRLLVPALFLPGPPSETASEGGEVHQQQQRPYSILTIPPAVISQSVTSMHDTGRLPNTRHNQESKPHCTNTSRPPPYNGHGSVLRPRTLQSSSYIMACTRGRTCRP